MEKCNLGEWLKTTSLPCSHMFHRECISNWVYNKEECICPTCKSSLSIPEYEHLLESPIYYTRDPDMRTFRIKTLTGATFNIKIHQSCSIFILKFIIFDRLGYGIPENCGQRMKLVANGKTLENEVLLYDAESSNIFAIVRH